MLLRILICVGLIGTLAQCQLIETHYFPTGECGPSEPSPLFYSYTTGKCYSNRTLTGDIDCVVQMNCLSQNLDYDDYLSCLMNTENSVTLVNYGGTFEVTSGLLGHYYRSYSSIDCSGNAILVPINDECNVNKCGIKRIQWFPQLGSENVIDYSSSDDDDSDELTGGEIAGIVIGSVGVVLLCCLCLCGCFAICCICLCIVLFVIVSVISVITMIISMILKRKVIDKHLIKDHHHPDDDDL